MKKLLSILSITAIICSLSLSQAIAMEAKSGDMKSDQDHDGQWHEKRRRHGERP